MVMITTLDATPLLQSSTRSGRPIKWIPLGLIHTEAATSLFRPYFKMSTTEKRKVLLLCVSDCNGHGRSLEALGTTLAETTTGNLISSYSEIMKHHHPGHLIGFVPHGGRDSICACREDLAPTQMIGTKTFKGLVKDGIYLIIDLKGEAEFPGSLLFACASLLLHPLL